MPEPAATPEPMATPGPASPLPEPAQVLELPINRRTISAGASMSAVITEDGSMWEWGGFITHSMWTFMSYVFLRVEQGALFIWDADGNLFTPDGTLHRDETMFFLDARSFYLGRYGEGARRNINDLEIKDEAGNPFTFADFAQSKEEEMNFLLSPLQVAENAASVHATGRGWGSRMINEDGVLVFVGGYRTDDIGLLYYRADEIFDENIADFVFANHNWEYPHPPGTPMNVPGGVATRNMVTIRYGVMHTDGTFYLVAQGGATRRPFEANIIAMDFGTEHMLLLAYNGQLWARGSGSAVGVLRHQGTAPPAFVMDNVVQIAAGGRHSMAVTTDGRLYAWGITTEGQVGNGNRHPQNLPVFIMDNVIAIAAGEEHSMAITADGVLWGWGDNRFGQVGHGSDALYTRPVQVMENVVAVSAGYAHTLAVTSDGNLWAWGRNNNGQLGDGTRYDRAEPVLIMAGI